MSSALSAKRLQVRFAAKRMFELLNRLFNWGRSHNLQSRSKYAGNRGELTLFEGELTLSQSFKYGRSHNLHSRNIESAESRRKNPL